MKINKIITIASLMVTGCTVGPKYEPPSVEIPFEWHSAPSDGMTADSPDCLRWWEALEDPCLNSLIERAALQSPDMHIAIARILQTRAERKGVSASYYPHIDGTANYGHVRYDNRFVKDILGSSYDHQHNKRNINFFEAGFDAEWEIDLFGKTAHETKAADAAIESSKENARDVMVSLCTEVARNYIELRGLQLRLQIIQNNINDQQEMIDLTHDLLNIGMASIIDQWQTEEQLHTLAAQKPLIELSIDQTIHHLSVLLGHPPGELFCELSVSRALPQLPYDKPLGIPSELLRRRPDIRRAERDLAAATEQVGAAVAALFPRLSLRGFIGDITAHLNRPGFTWFAGPELVAPLFNSRLLRQDVDLNKVKVKQALYGYEKTVLGALEETENAIAAFHYGLGRSHDLAHAELKSYNSYEIIHELYGKGLKNYFEVLTASRSLSATQDAHIQSRIQMLMHYISLYKALGGGWEIADCD